MEAVEYRWAKAVIVGPLSTGKICLKVGSEFKTSISLISVKILPTIVSIGVGSMSSNLVARNKATAKI